jgi:hypothetical protein
MLKSYDLGRELLKWLAILTMSIDHVGAALYPQYIIFRYIGRLSFPLFAYILVLGLESTRDPKNYLIRLIIFAFISQIPFFLAFDIKPWEHLNIFFTLSSGVLFLYLYEKKNFLFFIPLIVSAILRFDYGIYGILSISCMYFLRKDKKLGASFFLLLNILFLSISTTQSISILALPLILLHNNGGLKMTRKINAQYMTWRKYFFYIFYPLHLSILYFFRIFVI